MGLTRGSGLVKVYVNNGGSGRVRFGRKLDKLKIFFLLVMQWLRRRTRNSRGHGFDSRTLNLIGSTLHNDFGQAVNTYAGSLMNE